MINLNKKEYFYLGNKFYIIKKGSVCVRNVLENGHTLPKEGSYSQGDILGNFFHFSNFDKTFLPNLELEITALEDNTILEEFNFNYNSILSLPGFEQLFEHLIRENVFRIFYHLYDKKGYVLSVLKFYSNSKGILLKDKISHEYFNISKSQFYSTISELKQNSFIFEKNKKIVLNLEKISTYLSNYQDSF